MLVKTFDKHAESGLYTVRYHLPHDMMKTIRRFESLSVLNCGPYERFNL